MSTEPNLFGELLSLMSMEELHRYRLRAYRKKYEWLIAVLSDEIAERELKPSLQ